jgi:hypothetical protein
MQQTRKRLEGPGSQTRIADLRSQFQSASTDIKKPPKPRKAVKRESEDERAAKAERQALAQHTTSLLAGGKPARNYQRPGKKAERKGGGGFLFQLLLVMIVAGGVAYALDPSIVPQEWIDKARDFVGQYVKI